LVVRERENEIRITKQTENIILSDDTRTDTRTGGDFGHNINRDIKSKIKTYPVTIKPLIINQPAATVNILNSLDSGNTGIHVKKKRNKKDELSLCDAARR